MLALVYGPNSTAETNKVNSVWLTPLILVCVGQQSAARKAFNLSRLFAVHILARDQQEVALAFAKSSDDKAHGIPWEITTNGTPMLKDYMVALECRLKEEFYGGDHAIIIGQIIDIKIKNCDRAPMTYYKGKLNTLVHCTIVTSG